MAKKGELTHKQELVGDLYLTDFNGTQAYKTIYKCSLKSAEANASRLLKTNKMQAYLQKRMSEMQTGLKMNAESVLLECVRIAQSDPLNAMLDDGTIKPLKDIPIDLRRVIKSFEVEETWENFEDEDEVTTTEKSGRIIKISFWSKDKQIGNLMKYHKMFENKDDDKSEKDVITKLIEELGQDGKGLDIKI